MFVTFSSLYSFEGSDLSGFSIDIPYADKIVHFIFYFVGSVFGSLYISEVWKEKTLFIEKLKIFAFSLIIFGIIIEVVQKTMTTNRVGDVFDALANSIGAILGIIGVFAWFYKQKGLK